MALSRKSIPCAKDCPDRSQHCHGTCERYKKWQREFSEEKERLVSQKKEQADANAYFRAVSRKINAKH